MLLLSGWLLSHMVGGTPPHITVYRNVNNVNGRAPYKASRGPVHYLGSYTALKECEDVCIAYVGAKGERCWSFAWHQTDMIDPDPQSYATLCYAVTDGSFCHAKETNVTSGIVEWPAPPLHRHLHLLPRRPDRHHRRDRAHPTWTVN